MVTHGQPPNNGNIRHQLYECVDDTELSIKEKQRQVLEIGRRSLDVETAHIQHQIDDETHQVVTSVGNDTVATPEGVTLDRATTYCRRTIESHSPIALSNAPEEGWANDPAYEEHGWDCYLGATIFVDGDVYGTVCFVSETARKVDFSADEKALVELIARLLGRAIEATEYEQRLAETNRDKQRSEAKYEALLQLSPDAVVVADAETGHIQTANDKAATLTGYTVDELREMSVIDLHPAERREQYVELLTESATTIITEQFEDGDPLYIERADGTTVPIELGLREIELDDRRLKLGIIRDISERREREQELKRQQVFLQQTQETVNLGGWELDFDDGFSQVTDETLRIFDLSLGDDITIELICDCIHSDDQATLRDAFEQLETSGDPFDLELRLECDGDSRWMRMIGKPLDEDDPPSGARGIVRDISDRKARKRDLRLKDRAIEESSVGITIADANEPDLPIVYANRGFEQVTGYSQSAIFGRNCRFLQGSDTDDQTVAEIREAIEQEESIQTEVLNYRANGTPFWNNLTIAPVMGSETDDVTHFVGIQDDITAQKRRERLIEVLDRVLRHNLRNDMNVIEGFADVIGQNAEGEVAEMARRIKETATQLSSLSETVRDFETEMTDPEPLAPRDIVADVRTVVADLGAEYPETNFSVVSEAEVSVWATHQLQVALRELGDNAAKHGNSPVEFEVTATDDEVSVHVHDSGPGLPTPEQRILDTGHETPLEHGSGLGIWLVNWIVTSLGGEVTATLDGGTTVTIRLPVAVDITDGNRHRTAAPFSDSLDE